jgi:hypothetical protein
VAWETAAGGPTEATQAVLEEDTPGSSTANTYISPEVAHFHPGVLKAWIQFHHPQVTDASYGVTGIVNDATGDYTVTFDAAFSSALYLRLFCNGDEDRQIAVGSGTTPVAGSIQLTNTVSSTGETVNVGTTQQTGAGVGFAGELA